MRTSDQTPTTGRSSTSAPAALKRPATIIVISHDDRYYHLGDRIVKLEYGTLAP